MRTPFLLLFVLLLGACSRQPETPAPTKSENASNGGRVVEMKKVAQDQVGLLTAPATIELLAEHLNVTGTVQPVDSRVAHVRPLARGRIEQVSVRVGDRVRERQQLARFDNLEAGELAAQYRAAQAEARKLKVAQAAAARQSDRNRRLAELGAVPRKDFEASQADEQAAREAILAQESVAESLAARLRRFGVTPQDGTAPIFTIAAPISGIVVGVNAAPGELIDGDRELFTVADLSTVWVQAEVYEKDLGRIRTGQSAVVEVDAYAERPFTGKVTYIGDVVDPKTRTVKVRCEVPNPSLLLKLDMFAAIRLPTATRRSGLAVPESALQRLNSHQVVFVKRSAERFEVRPVTVGMMVNGRAEIVSGLSRGEEVVVEGSFHLKSALLESQIAKEE